MVSAKRVIAAVVFGFITGFLCYLGGNILLNMEINTVKFLWMLLNRALIGFVIGISALRIHWALHGILIGLIVGLPFTFYDFMMGYGFSIVMLVLVMGPVFGFLIELFTSVVFKAKIEGV